MSMIGLLQTMKDAARAIETTQAKQTAQLSSFRRMSREMFHEVYSVCFEKTKIEAHKRGFEVSEQPLHNGSIKLQVVEAA